MLELSATFHVPVTPDLLSRRAATCAEAASSLDDKAPACKVSTSSHIFFRQSLLSSNLTASSKAALMALIPPL